ncbi:MAG TPA: hypothetical protein VFW78_01365 [Bacteroidia bacterium]|nr:hypothetical protein [Bacteroidia bacterium]
MKVTAKALNKGRNVTSSGTLGYNSSGGMMITHFDSPKDNWIFLNSKGELRIYDPGSNSVIIEPNSGATSKANYMYYFLNGQTGDMGLKALGFSVTDSRFEDGLVITTWMPPSVMAGMMGKVELVHENYRPIYTGWYDLHEQCLLKTYYSDYTLIGNIAFPQTVTEIRFAQGDSTIEKKTYSDIKLNSESEQLLFDFRIPQNAKIITHN